jgi:hypothetical protein
VRKQLFHKHCIVANVHRKHAFHVQLVKLELGLHLISPRECSNSQSMLFLWISYGHFDFARSNWHVQTVHEQMDQAFRIQDQLHSFYLLLDY